MQRLATVSGYRFDSIHRMRATREMERACREHRSLLWRRHSPRRYAARVWFMTEQELHRHRHHRRPPSQGSLPLPSGRSGLRPHQAVRRSLLDTPFFLVHEDGKPGKLTVRGCRKLASSPQSGSLSVKGSGDPSGDGPGGERHGGTWERGTVLKSFTGAVKASAWHAGSGIERPAISVRMGRGQGCR